MASHHIYSPIIKGKDNDIQSIGYISNSAREVTKPLIELMPYSENAKSKKGSKTTKTVDAHVVSFVENIRRYVPLGEIYVDFSKLKVGLTTKDGLNPIIAGYEYLSGHHRALTPVYVLHRDDSLWPLLKPIVIRNGQGFCFRLTLEDIDDSYAAEETWQEITYRGSDLGLQPQQIDILLDLENIRGKSEELVELVTDFFVMNPNVRSYRSLTVVGTSNIRFVTDIGVPMEGSKFIRREELDLWVTLHNDLALNKQLVFGDYGIVHPHYSDQGGSSNMNARAVYTEGSRIHYFRGHGLFKPRTDFPQYYVLAERVCSEQFFREGFSHGDKYISSVRNRAGTPGDPGSWVLAGMNSHMEYTAHQLKRNLLVSPTESLSLSGFEQ